MQVPFKLLKKGEPPGDFVVLFNERIMGVMTGGNKVED